MVNDSAECNVSQLVADEEGGLGSSLGTTLSNATNATYMTVQAKRDSQGFIGQTERTRGTSLN